MMFAQFVEGFLWFVFCFLAFVALTDLMNAIYYNETDVLVAHAKKTRFQKLPLQYENQYEEFMSKVHKPFESLSLRVSVTTFHRTTTPLFIGSFSMYILSNDLFPGPVFFVYGIVVLEAMNLVYGLILAHFKNRYFESLTRDEKNQLYKRIPDVASLKNAQAIENEARSIADADYTLKQIAFGYNRVLYAIRFILFRVPRLVMWSAYLFILYGVLSK